jgi:hypothetical protein
MTPTLEETIHLDFITSSSTGAAADADSTPTCEVFEDATDTAILSPAVTKRASKTGNYRVPVACTAGNGFEAGKTYNVIASATIGGVAAKCKIGTFQVRARSADDGMTLADGAITTAAIADDAITDAKIAVPAEAAGRPSRVLAMLRRTWERMANKRTRDRGTGTKRLFGADGTTVLETQTQSTTSNVDQETQGA